MPNEKNLYELFNQPVREKCPKCGGIYFDYRTVFHLNNGVLHDDDIYESDLTKVNIYQCIECLKVVKVQK